MRMSDCSSDVCSSDLLQRGITGRYEFVWVFGSVFQACLRHLVSSRRVFKHFRRTGGVQNTPAETIVRTGCGSGFTSGMNGKAIECRSTHERSIVTKRVKFLDQQQGSGNVGSGQGGSRKPGEK